MDHSKMSENVLVSVYFAKLSRKTKRWLIQLRYTKKTKKSSAFAIPATMMSRVASSMWCIPSLLVTDSRKGSPRKPMLALLSPPMTTQLSIRAARSTAELALDPHLAVLPGGSHQSLQLPFRQLRCAQKGLRKGRKTTES